MIVAKSAVLAVSAGGIMAFSPFGLPMDQIALGMVVTVLGLSAKFGFDLASALNADQKVKYSRSLAMFSLGLLSVPFVTIMWLEILNSIGAKADALTVIGLLLFGFLGTKGITLLVGGADALVGKVIPKGTKP